MQTPGKNLWRHPLKDLSINSMLLIGEYRDRTCLSWPLKSSEADSRRRPNEPPHSADEEREECNAPRRGPSAARIPSIILDDEAGDLVGHLKGMAVSTPNTGSYGGAGLSQRRCGAETPFVTTLLPFFTRSLSMLGSHVADAAALAR